VSAVIRAAREMLGLVVDDGSLAAALVLWIAIAGFVLPRLGDGTGALMLAAGCLLILIENIRRSVRR
jgi:hypothetical protein